MKGFVRLDKLMTTSGARGTTENAGVQLDGPVSLHSANDPEGGEDKDSGHAEQI